MSDDKKDVRTPDPPPVSSDAFEEGARAIVDAFTGTQSDDTSTSNMAASSCMTPSVDLGEERSNLDDQYVPQIGSSNEPAHDRNDNSLSDGLERHDQHDGTDECGFDAEIWPFKDARNVEQFFRTWREEVLLAAEDLMFARQAAAAEEWMDIFDHCSPTARAIQVQLEDDDSHEKNETSSDEELNIDDQMVLKSLEFHAQLSQHSQDSSGSVSRHPELTLDEAVVTIVPQCPLVKLTFRKRPCSDGKKCGTPPAVLDENERCHSDNATDPRSISIDKKDKRKDGNIGDKKKTGAPDAAMSEPFLKLEDVSAGSPASSAGLRHGDMVLKFDTLDKTSFVNMQQLCEIVNRSIGRPINLIIRRRSRIARIALVPMTWAGLGLVGCKVAPVGQYL